MHDSDYYPAGAAHDSNAPYNEVPTPEVEVECCVTCTLERDTTVLTDEVYWDDGWELEAYADLDKAYDYDYMSIPALFEELVKYIDEELKTTTSYQRKVQLKKMRKSAIGWEFVEQNIEVI